MNTEQLNALVFCAPLFLPLSARGEPVVQGVVGAHERTGRSGFECGGGEVGVGSNGKRHRMATKAVTEVAGSAAARRPLPNTVVRSPFTKTLHSATTCMSPCALGRVTPHCDVTAPKASVRL